MLVPSIAFDPQTHGSLPAALLNASRARMPVVFTGVQFADYEGVSCERTPWRGQAFAQEGSPIFFHEKRAKPLAFIEPARRRRIGNASCADLLSPDAGFMFASEDVSHLVSPALTEALTVPEVSAKPASVNVWMGSRGVVSAAHFDYHHNVYLQLAGSKQWTLAPPSEALRLRLFPEAHPRDRQSQAGLRPPPSTCSSDGDGGGSSSSEDFAPGGEHADESPAAAAEAAASSEASVWPAATASSSVVLRAGELLYLPPLYFHRVAAPVSPDTLVIALNAFSDSEENLAEREMVEAQLPASVMHAHSPDGFTAASVAPHVRIQALAAFLRLAIHRSLTDAVAHEDASAGESGLAEATVHASAFLHTHISSRWSPLFAPLGCDTFDEDACPRAREPLPPPLLLQVREHAESIAQALRRRTRHLEAVWGAETTTSAREVLLIRYVERILAHFLGDPKIAGPKLCPFLRCLALEDAWS